MGNLFGTDGIRGIANTQLTPELAYRVGRAAAYYFISKRNEDEQNNAGKPRVYIGRDTRLSSRMLVSALESGICSSGANVIRLGVVPTPAVAYLTRKNKAMFGIAVTASHNPFPDNGIKFFSKEGYKLPDQIEDEIEAFILAPQDNMPRPSAEKVGAIDTRHKYLKEYIRYMKAIAGTTFEDLKIVIDCGHGAAVESTPKTFKQLGAQITVLNNRPNGYNINDGCGSTHMEALQEAVVNCNADFGIAHDGDADRCLAVDETGAIVDGDQLMLICALDMMKEKKLIKNTIVTTVMSNMGFYNAAKEHGLKVLTTPVGDRYVLEEMLGKGLNLGGEQSGHIIFSEHSTTGDGLLTAVKLAAALKKSGKKLSELASLMTRYPQLLVNIQVKDKEGILEVPSVKRAIASAEKKLGSNGRILVRMSGTEPLLRIMAEGPSQPELEKLVKKIADKIKKEQGE